MFTGIVEEVGKIKNIKKGIKSSILEIKGSKIFDDIHIGDSIAVNGICLTVTSFNNTTFTADVMPETMQRTSLGILKTDSLVNLERAMPANGRFGGHIVSGHIDSTGIITNLKKDDNAVWITISTDKNILKYIVEKGSIAIDGISLTVAYVNDKVFKVSIIPHTKENTALLSKKVNDIVNLECDIVGKYIEKFLNFEQNNIKNKKDTNISKNFLIENGFI